MPQNIFRKTSEHCIYHELPTFSVSLHTVDEAQAVKSEKKQKKELETVK